ncbi:hypothetical protein [Nocardioides lianchengensis]|uniref:Uncharacterized protein n=1 Tax=Nocardioides lianchengensis TaxID=1045774 RepID=A0A1G6TST7_9ACTN|nr:hypothetical protein [Nocardioides lianchengensis]NYG11655.1 hypothetical protein [Nocardioides lianchengensis]SDD32091.1 hypothetical protein SAMN05421872_107179 [Nocardioides lianchengensis]
MPPTTEPFWTALVDDAAIFPPGDADLVEAAHAYAVRDEPLVGSFVLRDTDLPVVAAAIGTDLPVSVVLTGGAGQVAGPAALCTRNGIRLAGLEVALRDPDDLPGNARRVVAAVDAARAEGALAEDAPVYVELPPTAPSYGWLAAADEVAGAELRLKYRTNEAPARDLAAWIDAALDRETPFKCTAGLHRALRHDPGRHDAGHGFLNVLLATVRAFDGASADEVVATLEDRAPDLDADELARGRRWFTSFGSCSVDEPLADLRVLGLA